MSDVKLGPIDQSERFEALDVLRGIAALGILLMNIPFMGLSTSWPFPSQPVRANADWIAVSIQNVGADGSMRGLFTLLFGAGMVVMLTRADPARETAASQAFFVRCFALMLLGVVNCVLFLWPGEILFNYGVAALFVFPFRKAPNRLLAVAAAAGLVVMTLGSTVTYQDKIAMLRLADDAVAARSIGKQPTPEQADALKKRDAMVKQLTSPETREQERKTHTSFPAVVVWSTADWVDYNLTGHNIVWELESVSFMLIGILLFRTGVLTGQRSMRFYVGMALSGLVVGIALRGYVLSLMWQSSFVPSAHWFVPRVYLYQAGRLPMTLGILGLALALLKAGLLGRMAEVLAAVGRMALTTYIGQSIIAAILFDCVGLFGRFGFAQLMGVTVLIWGVQCLFSVAWLRWFEMGPAEWLLRTVTYGAARPIRRAGIMPGPSGSTLARGAQ